MSNVQLSSISIGSFIFAVIGDNLKKVYNNFCCNKLEFRFYFVSHFTKKGVVC